MVSRRSAPGSRRRHVESLEPEALKPESLECETVEDAPLVAQVAGDAPGGEGESRTRVGAATTPSAAASAACW